MKVPLLPHLMQAYLKSGEHCKFWLVNRRHPTNWYFHRSRYKIPWDRGYRYFINIL